MPKSRAEIQRAYRQRLKEKDNAAYLERERERMKRNYVPSTELSENDRKRRNLKNREKLRRFYKRKREERLVHNQPDQVESSGYESGKPSTSQRGRIRVRMNFGNNRRKGALRRWKREISEANSRIRQLEGEREHLQKQYRAAKRTLQRQRQKNQKEGASNDSTMTPRKLTERMMTDANLTENQKKSMRKPLLFGNVVSQEIKTTKLQTPRSKMKAVHHVVSGKIMKKYKCATYLSKVTGLCRHRLTKSQSKDHQIKKSTRMSTIKIHQNTIETFLKREDNSRTQPGKCDMKKVKTGEKVQTHVLTDYLSNLYNKFTSENPTLKLSFTTFCRSRPKYILTAAFSSRNSCLCTRHQNAAITMKTLRRIGFNVSVNPEKGIEQIPSPESMTASIEENVSLGQWKRVEVEERGKRKFVTKIVETQMDAVQFISHIEKQMSEFASHVTRVKTQYEQIRTLKEKLPQNEMIVQLDFAENYSCKSLEEVQSAYFNQTSVTIHPIVVYKRSDDINLQHRSFIVISDEMAHRASTVITFISDLIPLLKEMDKNVKCIHYWSDSPTSQYRNKQMFNFVANHEQKCGIKARWNYFEAGHGKGPCDGLGGTCKRLADEAMRSGKVVIQDAHDFYNWALKSSMTSVTFRFVASDECSKTEASLAKIQLKPIKGTMKVHAVVGIGDSRIKVKQVSCYCEECISGSLCASWNIESTETVGGNKNKSNKNSKANGIEASTTNESDTVLTNDRVHQENENSKHVDYKIGDFLAAVYEKKWYIGQISDIDIEDKEIEINFMESRKGLYKWPSSQDLIWLDLDSVLCQIKEPGPTGKSCRMFSVSAQDKDKILEAYSAYENKTK